MNPGKDKFLLLFEKLPDAFSYNRVVTDEQGAPVDYTFIEVNAAFEEMTGLERGKIVGKKASDILPGIVNSEFDWIGTCGQVARGGDAVRFEHYLDPAERWYEVCACSDEQGYFVTVFRDISKYKGLELESKGFSGRLKAIIDNSPLLISEIKPGGQYLMVNNALAKSLNKTPPEVEGCYFEDLLPPEKVKLFNRRVNTVVIKNEPIRVDDQVNVDGKEYYFTTTLFPLRDSSGRVGSVGSIAHDITDRVEAEKALREREEKLSGILSNMTDVVWSISWPDFRHIYLNPALEKLYGRPARDFYADPALFKEVTHPEDRHLTEKAIEQLLAEGEAARECRIVRPDGSIIWVDDRSKMIYDENRQPVRVDGITRDITERKRMEKELKEKEALEHLLMSMATELINVPLDELDYAMNRILEMFGRFSGLDRVYIFQHDNARRVTANTYEWCAEGITAEIDNLQDVPFELFPDFLELFSRGEPVHIPSVAAMPQEHAMRAHFEEQSIRSLLLLPLVDQGENVGFVGFDAVREEKEFSEVEINLLKVFAEMVVNIEKRRKSEKLLHESEKMLSSAFSAAENVSFITTDANPLEPRILNFSKGAEKIFGYSKDEVIGERIAILHLPEDISRLPRVMEAMQNNKEGFSGETVLVRKNGEHFPALFNTYPILDDEGNMSGTLGVSIDITGRKAVEEALAQSHENMTTVLESTLFGVAIIDRKRTIRWVNNVVCSMAGVEDPEALIGKQCGDYLCPAEQQDCPVFDHGQALDNSERILRRHDGQVIPILKTVTQINLEGEDVLLESFIDISELKTIREEISLQKERLANIIQGADVGTWEWNVQTGETRFNERWAEIVGHTLEEISPVSIETWEKFTHPDDLEKSNRELERHFNGDVDFYNVECRMKHKDGRWIWVNDRRKTISWTEDGRPLWVFGTHIDITDRKQTEEELLKFKTAVEQTTEGVAMSDMDGIILFINSAWAEMHGYTLDEVKGRHLSIFHNKEQLEKQVMPFNEILVANGSNQGEIGHTRKDKTVFPTHMISTVIRESEGKPFGLLAIAHDITERKKTEEALKLQAAERAAVDTFTYSVSNDLKAPLRRIEGLSEMLLEECPGQLNEKARDYLTRIITQVGSMKALTDALLQLSNVVSREIDREAVNLSALVRSNLERLQYKDPGRLVETVVNPGLIAEGDADLLNILLGNLVENAWKFTSGMEKARVEFGCTEQDGRTVYYLKDNGVGFDMNHADKLFTPFHKLHRDEEYPGIGIGLNLVYRIISRHGGEIWAEGEVGKGACFYFALP